MCLERQLKRDIIRFGVSHKRKLKIRKIRKKFLWKYFPLKFSSLWVDEGKCFIERENRLKCSSSSSSEFLQLLAFGFESFSWVFPSFPFSRLFSYHRPRGVRERKTTQSVCTHLCRWNFTSDTLLSSLLIFFLHAVSVFCSTSTEERVLISSLSFFNEKRKT